MADYKPISGERVYNALRDKDCIVMAANTRFIPGVADGILRAAKDTNTPVIIEIARSESDLKGGYTGYTPKDFAERIMAAAKRVQCEKWVLHADHIGIKEGTPEVLKGTKDLILAQIDSGFTSFAIDASHIFNFDGKDEKEELAGNLAATIEIANFIKDEMKKRGITSYGLEVEVGEVGRKGDDGQKILTTPKQAATFITELNKAGVYPHLLATNNGTEHGNVFDEKGQKIAKVGVDIPRTKEIAAALRQTGTTTRIAQHGITGTPLKWIASLFPKGDVLKGNVGTFWQDVFFTVTEIYEPELYKKMYDWTQTTYAGKGKSPEEIFGKNCKNAFKPFFAEAHAIKPETVKALEAKAYAEALIFFKAFNSLGKGSLVG